MRGQNTYFNRCFAILLILVMLAVCGGNASPASADETEPLYPQQSINVPGPWFGEWMNAQNLGADDGAYAYNQFDSPGGDSDYLEATHFGFDIPTGAQIDGIELMVSRFSSPVTLHRVYDVDVFLLKGGVVTGLNHAFPTHPIEWPTQETEITYGGPADLWEATWTPEDINAANFGVRFKARCWDSLIGYIDYMKIRVTYTDFRTHQTITIDSHAPEYRAVNDPPFTVAAHSSSGLPVTYFSSGGCTNNGATFTMTSSLVNCTVIYRQAGNADYAPAQVSEIVQAVSLPFITQQPTDSNVPEGRDARFTAAGNGAPVPTVQWQVSTDGGAHFDNLDGEVSPTLIIPHPSPTQTGYLYRAVFHNRWGDATTNSAALHVLTEINFLPVISR